MNFKKLGVIKKNNNSDNLFIFISSSNNYETIQRINNFYISSNNKYKNVEFKIIKKETNNILIKIVDMIINMTQRKVDNTSPKRRNIWRTSVNKQRRKH